nr:MAG TPA: hypothetical protein [Caudoviricetes sp.]
MPDTVHHVMWYTVYDAKSGNLLASGTSDMCARRLWYKSANSFASSVYHCRKKKRKPHKYSFFQEVIKRDEVDSLPPPATRGRPKRMQKKPAGAPTPTGCKG